MDTILFVCLCDLDGRYGFFGTVPGGVYRSNFLYLVVFMGYELRIACAEEIYWAGHTAAGGYWVSYSLFSFVGFWGR